MINSSLNCFFVRLSYLFFFVFTLSRLSSHKNGYIPPYVILITKIFNATSGFDKTCYISSVFQDMIGVDIEILFNKTW